METFTYIDTDAKLAEAASEWKKENVIGIDIECENNLHHYGAYITLIQLSTRKKRWVLDTLQVKDLKPMIQVLEDAKIQKIFHDVGFDLRIVAHELKCKVRNIFDTQIAAHLTGKTDLGLAALLEEYFKVKKEKKFQMADWTRRPIKKDMLEYAVKDTKYLILLRDILTKELKAKDRWDWAQEEFKQLEEKKWELHLPDYDELKGYKLLTPRQRGILKQLYKLREKLAKQVDRPVHFVMSTKRMLDFVKEPPTLKQWETLKGVHPVVKRKARSFYDAVENGKKAPIEVTIQRVKRYSPQQRQKAARLNELSVKIADKFKVPKHLILNKEQIKDIVLTDELKSLRNWQKKIVLSFGYRPKKNKDDEKSDAKKRSHKLIIVHRKKFNRS